MSTIKKFETRKPEPLWKINIRPTYDVIKEIAFDGGDGTDTFSQDMITELKQRCDSLDEAVKKELLSGALPELSDVEFCISITSVYNLLQWFSDLEDGNDGQLNIMYYAVAEGKKGETVFFFTFTCPVDGYPQSSLVRMTENHEVSFYSAESMAWSKDEDTGKLFEIYEENGYEKDVVDLFKNAYDMPILLTNSKFLLDIIEKNRAIIDLAQELDGLCCFNLLATEFNEDKTDLPQNQRIAIVSDDISRKGTAVYYDDGEYVICQAYCLMGEERDLMVFEDGFTEDDMTKYNFFRVVERTADREKVKTLCESMWDKYDRGLDWYTMPLSAEAYVNVTDDEYMINEPVFANEKKPLTINEAKNLRWLQDLFSRNPDEYEEE